MNAHLSVLRGEWDKQTFDVPQGKLVVGREVDCHLRSESAFISRHHCVLLNDDYTLRVRDLGSKNGTFVNGQRIGCAETVLHSGDLIAVGAIEFQIIVEGAVADVDVQASTGKESLAGSTLRVEETFSARAPRLAGSARTNKDLIGHLG
jgi:pSer/pThr/pTyr-binding forkhead associated (FHA) protein